MPTFICTGSTKQITDAYTLSLNSEHCLIAQQPSERGVKMKTFLPSSIDVLHSSDITFTLSGIEEGDPVSSAAMKQSAVTRHIVDYFQKVHLSLDSPKRSVPADIECLRMRMR